MQMLKKTADVPAAACSKPVSGLEKSDSISGLLEEMGSIVFQWRLEINLVETQFLKKFWS